MTCNAQWIHGLSTTRVCDWQKKACIKQQMLQTSRIDFKTRSICILKSQLKKMFGSTIDCYWHQANQLANAILLDGASFNNVFIGLPSILMCYIARILQWCLIIKKSKTILQYITIK